jgi:TatD DNase family protein
MFDSHCHLDAAEYDPDRDAVIARARSSGVSGIMVPGYEPDEWPGLAQLCAGEPMLCCAVGLHPWYVHRLDQPGRKAALERLPDVARQLRARAIGECGLDASMAKRGGADMQTQERVLDAQLEVARQLALPVILHCVAAHALLLGVLKRHGNLPAGGVLHSYSGSRELIRDYLRFGLCFGFAGIVTRDNARRPREALGAVPLERLLVESDGPDQPAQGVSAAPSRASAPGASEPSKARSEPAHVVLVLAAAAQIRGQSRELLAQATQDNARRLFGLLP